MMLIQAFLPFFAPTDYFRGADLPDDDPDDDDWDEDDWAEDDWDEDDDPFEDDDLEIEDEDEVGLESRFQRVIREKDPTPRRRPPKTE